MAWTLFTDLHSGGKTKEPPYEYILIEAPEAEAISIFRTSFSREPWGITCSCCGPDYSIDEEMSLTQAAKMISNAPLKDVLARPDVMVIGNSHEPGGRRN